VGGETLAHLGADVAEAFALAPASVDQVTVTWLGKVKKFACYVGNDVVFSGMDASAAESVRQAVDKMNAGHSYVAAYSAAVDRMPA
jgi:hypothetical protein